MCRSRWARAIRRELLQDLLGPPAEGACAPTTTLVLPVAGQGADPVRLLDPGDDLVDVDPQPGQRLGVRL